MQRESEIPDQARWPSAAASGWVSRLFFWLVKAFPRARKIAYGLLFDLIAAVTQKLSSVTIMNYGFADLEDGAGTIELAPSEEPERYSLQLYDRVAGAARLRGRDVLDVSCGRGGGTRYILRYLGAGRVTGLDNCPGTIDFCRRIHRDPDLSFVHGEAEALPFDDGQFDAVVNIESSFCYGDMDRFLSEVRRVLKHGGHFAFADLRHSGEVTELLESLERSGLEILERADISRNVERALELDAARRADGVRRAIPPPLRAIFGTYAGVRGSRIPNLLERGDMVYLRFLLRKPNEKACIFH